MKVYVVDAQGLVGNPQFREERAIIEGAGCELLICRCETEEDVIRECGDADAIITYNLGIGGNTIKNLNKCKVIVRGGIGYDIIDLKAAGSRGIYVCNIPHYCAEEVATHSTAMILAASRNLLFYTMKMREGRYREQDEQYRAIHRLSTQTVGIAGFGFIARISARQLTGLGFRVISYDPYVKKEVFEQEGVEKVELDELFAGADIITLHTPYTPETHHMINKDSIAKMKDGVIIVNTARGALIDEAALVDALKSGKVGSAGLDVFDEEPFTDTSHPFCHMDNVLLSPHAAFNSLEATEEHAVTIGRTVADLLHGKLVENIVNKKELGL